MRDGKPHWPPRPALLRPTIFRFSKVSRFPSKYAKSGGATLTMTPIIHNVHNGFMIFNGFFGRTLIPPGKNENKWHKSAFYIPGRNSTIDYL
jgi:hypothetical protein